MFHVTITKPDDALLTYVALEEYQNIQDDAEHAMYTSAPYALSNYCMSSLFGNIGMPDAVFLYLPRSVLFFLKLLDHHGISRDFMREPVDEYVKSRFFFDTLLDPKYDDLTEMMHDALAELFEKLDLTVPSQSKQLKFSGFILVLNDIFLTLGVSNCYEVAVPLTHDITEVWKKYRFSILLLEHDSEDSWEPMRHYNAFRDVLDAVERHQGHHDTMYRSPFRGGGFSCIS